jgi:hypothetical protein
MDTVSPGIMLYKQVSTGLLAAYPELFMLGITLDLV